MGGGRSIKPRSIVSVDSGDVFLLGGSMMGLSQMKRIPPRWIDRPTVDQLKPLTSCFFTVTFTVATAVFTPRHTTLPALELRPTLPSRARVFQFKKGKEKKHFVGTKRADGRRLQQVLRKRWTENGLVHYPNSGPSSAGDSSWAIYFLFCRCPFVKQVHGFFHCFFFVFFLTTHFHKPPSSSPQNGFSSTM